MCSDAHDDGLKPLHRQNEMLDLELADEVSYQNRNIFIDIEPSWINNYVLPITAGHKTLFSVTMAELLLQRFPRDGVPDGCLKPAAYYHRRRCPSGNTPRVAENVLVVSPSLRFRDMHHIFRGKEKVTTTSTAAFSRLSSGRGRWVRLAWLM